ncbi:cyclin-dependent kinase inhibitor 1B-like [Procambarus clarkii]|uniref:cyclin-dependent kinase inhibitor 1B-like n=1 Tax=Procambarus clarkii TaxID=6728 RepID=UPI001E6733F4|nr:cyclin-dependent kinase inhibitor 1B-like [Procambarus clarkii]
MSLSQIVRISREMSLPQLLRERMRTIAPTEDRSINTVKRKLFGPVDHAHNLKFVHEEMAKIQQADCKRWNFDFQEEKPLEGRYDWQPVDENVPQAYEIPNLTSRTSRSTHQSSSSSSSTSRRNKFVKRLIKRSPPPPSSKSTQKLCTDYFRQVKTPQNPGLKPTQDKAEVLPSPTKPAITKLTDILKIRSLNVR